MAPGRVSLMLSFRAVELLQELQTPTIVAGAIMLSVKVSTTEETQRHCA
jgi:hypothetical protein